MATPILQPAFNGAASVSFPPQYAGGIENLWSNPQGDNVNVNPATGDTLLCVVIGLKSFAPFNQFHSGYETTPQGWSAGLQDFNAPPVVQTFVGPESGIRDIVETSGFAVTLTVTYNSAWAASQEVYLTGLTHATWLNGQTVTLLTATNTAPVNSIPPAPGYSTLTFTDPTSHAGGIALTTETGAGYNVGTDTFALVASATLIESDYTPVSVPPPAGSPYPSSKWNLDGFYPSIYVFAAYNVQAGPYKVNVNSMYQNVLVAGTTPQGLPADWAAGSQPIFDGGINIRVIDLGGVAAAPADDPGAWGFNVDGAAADTIPPSNNPASAPTITTTATGDAIIGIALQKSGNVLGLGTDNVVGGLPTGDAMTMVANGKLVGSNAAHYMIEWCIQTVDGQTIANFANPLGYETVVGAIALKHS